MLDKLSIERWLDETLWRSSAFRSFCQRHADKQLAFQVLPGKSAWVVTLGEQPAVKLHYGNPDDVDMLLSGSLSDYVRALQAHWRGDSLVGQGVQIRGDAALMLDLMNSLPENSLRGLCDTWEEKAPSLYGAWQSFRQLVADHRPERPKTSTEWPGLATQSDLDAFAQAVRDFHYAVERFEAHVQRWENPAP